MFCGTRVTCGSDMVEDFNQISLSLVREVDNLGRVVVCTLIIVKIISPRFTSEPPRTKQVDKQYTGRETSYHVSK